MPRSWVLAVADLGLTPLAGVAAQGLDLGVLLIQGLDRHDRSLGEVAVALVRDLQALGQFLVHGAELELVHDRAGQEGRVAGALHADLPQHLRDDDLDVLVVDLHALAAVDVLDLAGEVVLHGLFARDAEDVVGDQRPVDQGLAGADEAAGVHAEVLAVRDEVLASRCRFRCGRRSSACRGASRPASSTVPSISAITAGSLGLRASKISVTRGRPPVMSCVPATSRGVLASSVPAETGCLR